MDKLDELISEVNRSLIETKAEIQTLHERLVAYTNQLLVLRELKESKNAKHSYGWFRRHSAK